MMVPTEIQVGKQSDESTISMPAELKPRESNNKSSEKSKKQRTASASNAIVSTGITIESGDGDTDQHFTPDMVLGVMETRSTSAKVQWKCLKLIIKMSYKQKHLGAEFLTAGAADHITLAMRKFPENRDLQYKGCAAFRNLTSPANKQHFMKVIDAGGVEALIAAMKLYPNDEDLQEDACTSLYNLAVNNHSMIKSAIKAKGGTVVLADAERRFLGTDCVVEKKARGALEKLYLA